MSAKRIKRPKLERDRPVRTWSTLFGGGQGVAAKPPSEPLPDPVQPDRGSKDSPPAGPALSDTVELGYRVIDEYLKQGQQVAQAFNPSTWGGSGASPNELSQMAQRVMQYGWDFAGLWFEMWNRMAANSGGSFSPMAQPPPNAPSNGSHVAASPTPPSAPSAGAEQATPPARLVVSVACERPTTTAVDLRPGSSGRLVVHTLMCEGDDQAAIRDVTITPADADGTITINVIVPRDAKAGTYNAMIIDAVKNLPRGTLSVQIQDPKS